MEPKEVVFERSFDAPIETVWNAWTDPEQLKQWWGPQNVDIPECELDLRTGGRWYIVMEAGEAMGPYKGTRWPMEATFTAVEKPTKLAYTAKAWTEGMEDKTGIDQTAELTLADNNGKTNMTLTVTLTKAMPGADAAVQGMTAGYNSQFDKLATFLQK